MSNWITVGGVFLSMLLTHASVRANEAEQRALAAIQRLGGSFNPQTAHLILFETSVTDGDLQSIAALTPLCILNLNVTGISDDGLAHLHNLTNLTTLSLARTQVTGAGLKHLQGMTRLQSLVLRGTRVDDTGLKHLEQLKSLDNVHLEETRVGDAGLKHLAALPNLTSLGLNDTQVSDAGLTHLQGLTGLRSLDLRGTGVTGAGLKHLRGLKNLRYCLDFPALEQTLAQREALAELEKAGARVAETPSRWRPIADFDERQPPHAGLTITLGQQDLTDQDLTRLANLPQLQALIVRSHGFEAVWDRIVERPRRQNMSTVPVLSPFSIPVAGSNSSMPG
jgi:Leucine-rich repeat (LRR) protein